MRPALTALFALLLATAAAAQEPPLMTAPRPEDRVPTTPQPIQPNPSGAAPSDELRNLPPALPEITFPLTAAEARALIGHPVETRDGTAAGKIRDFTLTGPDGGIDRVVIGSGGLMGVGETLVTVPADALRIKAPTAVPAETGAPSLSVVLDLSAADLAAAPAFADDDSTRTLSER